MRAVFSLSSRRGSPHTWDPTPWVLGLVLAYLVGWWLAMHGCERYVVLLCLFVGGLVELSEQQRQGLVGDFRDALRQTDVGIRKAALHMGIDASDLEKMLRGLQRFDVWRIEMLPDETKRCFYFNRAQRLGLPTFVRQALKMAPAFGDVERRA